MVNVALVNRLNWFNATYMNQRTTSLQCLRSNVINNRNNLYCGLDFVCSCRWLPQREFTYAFCLLSFDHIWYPYALHVINYLPCHQSSIKYRLQCMKLQQPAGVAAAVRTSVRSHRGLLCLVSVWTGAFSPVTLVLNWKLNLSEHSD